MSSEKEVPILVFVGRHHTGLRALERVREVLGQDCHAGGEEGRAWEQGLGSLIAPVCWRTSRPRLSRRLSSAVFFLCKEVSALSHIKFQIQCLQEDVSESQEIRACVPRKSNRTVCFLQLQLVS